MNRQLPRAFFLVVALLGLYSPLGSAYSVLTHEAIIDVTWDASIRPLLLKRFPNATADELVKAHAYAYGGAIIQDMGYYPHGNKFFSDLTHYFRSGDFIVSLLQNAEDVNEYAFAIGALAHYAADNDGHRLATNLAVPMLYPELKAKYGPVVTYEDNPLAHMKTEFGFDVLQVAKGHYASDNYHQFIGFEVALPLLQKAFRDTYGIELRSVFQNEQLATNSYRNSVNSLIPTATRVAWKLKQDDIQKDLPGTTRQQFLYNLSRSSYEKEWGKDYRRPSAGDKFLAFLIRILPKIGPLKILTFRAPTPEVQTLFEKSFNATIEKYRSLLTALDHGRLEIPNDNFDVGNVTARGKYKLNDKTCAELLDRLSKQDPDVVSENVKSELLDFYAESGSDSTGKKRSKSEKRIDFQVEQLRASMASAAETTNSVGGNYR